MEAATFYNDLAEGPDGGQAWWVTASDGVRLRMGGWRCDQPKCTVLLFNGRSEYIEKYGRNADDFLTKGYNILTIDWRGQGLSDRLIKDTRAGHVCSFASYQHDVKALMDHAEAAGFAGPYYLIGHSMGGIIGFRALKEGLNVQAVVFSSPMWGIKLPLIFRPCARLIARVAVAIGMRHSYVLTGSPDNYVATNEFEGNGLTNDRSMYAYLQRQARAVPQFALGSPTMNWLRNAFDEIDFVQSSQAPDLPCITFLGGDEDIVNVRKVRARATSWPGAKLIEIPGGRHEMLMDSPELRRKITDDICAFFDAQRTA